MSRKPSNSYAVNRQHSDDSWAVGAGFLRLMGCYTSQGRPYWLGEFVSRDGIVSVLREATFTRLDFAYDGRGFSRSWDAYYGERTICRLARAFVSDIMGEYA